LDAFVCYFLVVAVACLVMPGRLLDWMPPFYILVLSSVVWWSCYWIYAACDVTIWRHIHVCTQRFGEVCWHNIHIQGRRSRAGWAI